MLDEQRHISEESQAAQDLADDLEPTDETAAGISGGDGSTPGTGRVSISPILITKFNDTASPNFFM
jgi:type VI protein secretion system component Hcp